ncbi:uncharacterized protein [Clinocottus analis]|uniref:SERTA domain-containing protein 3 n=1 Tax=Clinocottus analis TaxID=304258 RepID=UPI0035BFD72C
MIIKGQKRKHPPEDVEVSDRSSPTWESQRQFVFSVSLNKYQCGQVLPEPSLRRSVLIANTLRLISVEACMAPSVDMEVSQPSCSSSSALQESIFTEGTAEKHHSTVIYSDSHSALVSCPLVSLDCTSNCATSRSPANYHLDASNVPLSVRVEDEDWGSMSTESDYSLSAAINSILTALDSIIDGGPQAAPRTPLRSLENLSGPCDGGVGWAKQGVRGYSGSWEQQVESSDLFQDIDTSLLERDMGVLGLRGNGGGYQTEDDFYQYLPTFSSSTSSHTAFPSLSTRI